jgi:hypothetical protein
MRQDATRCAARPAEAKRAPPPHPAPPHPTRHTPPPQRLRCLAKAADSISCGDIVNRRVRSAGQWALMPFAALIGSVTPASYVRGIRESVSDAPDVSRRRRRRRRRQLGAPAPR